MSIQRNIFQILADILNVDDEDLQIELKCMENENCLKIMLPKCIDVKNTIVHIHNQIASRDGFSSVSVAYIDPVIGNVCTVCVVGGSPCTIAHMEAEK